MSTKNRAREAGKNFIQQPDFGKYTDAECAFLCNVSPATWWRWNALAKTPPSIKIGGSTRWNAGEIHKFLGMDAANDAVYTEASV